MNFASQFAMNQVKDQAQNLIPKEVKEGENPGEGKIENSEDNQNPNPDAQNDINKSKASHKKKLNKKINKQLVIRMYTVLLFHTGLLTLVEFIIHIIQEKNEKVFNKDYNIVYIILFIGSIALAALVSFFITKIKCFANVVFIYALYVALLALDLSIFNLGGYLLSFQIFVSMLLVFDGGSIVVLLFCSFSKTAPSPFWVICSSIGGIIIAVFLSTTIYQEDKTLVLIFGVISFFIYEVMNYNTFNDDNKKKKKEKKEEQQKEEEKEPEVKIPPMMILPYEFNASFIKIFYFIFKGIKALIFGCCAKK